MQHELDSVDSELIRQLQQDGRRPFTQLAKSVGLSESAVRQRVGRLIDAGVMQIVAVTDPLSLGLIRQAQIAINVEGDLESVAAALRDLDEVIYLILTAGPTDILCEVVVESDERLLELINDHVRSIPGVRSTETTIYLRCDKQTYRWSVG